MKARSPESLMMSYGYDPYRTMGSLKPPIYQTSTFVFKTAEEGKAWFAKAYQLAGTDADQTPAGYLYSRVGNPNLDILEKRLSLWENAEDCAVFSSGMAALTSIFLTCLKPGDLLVYSNPTYGGTDHVIHHILPEMGIHILGFLPGEEKTTLKQRILASGHADRLRLIFTETPANPTNALTDIHACRILADAFTTGEDKPLVCVDNTFMGPLWQHPFQFGADLVAYSATKYLSGHSDLIAGAVMGSDALISDVKTTRTFFGNMPGPMTAWLLTRSLETLKVRMDAQLRNAMKIARFLNQHPAIQNVLYPQFLDSGSEQSQLFARQCSSPGAMISFEVGECEADAFRFMNQLHLIKMAVSLGGTECLIQHPATMTHAGLEHDHKIRIGINDNLVRLSVGIENPDDLIHDLKQSLDLLVAEKAGRYNSEMALV